MNCRGRTAIVGTLSDSRSTQDYVQFGIGQSVRCKEDPSFITGTGRVNNH